MHFIYLVECVLELRNESDWFSQVLVRLVMFWLQIAGTSRSQKPRSQDLWHSLHLKHGIHEQHTIPSGHPGLSLLAHPQ